MVSKLIDICGYAKGKIAVAGLTKQTYISTENMLPNKGGITTATSLPSTEYTQAYQKNDVLVSNIRPYFKKIWHANCDGGCSNDVLVFRAIDGTDPTFLYYLLADDNFFNYATATSKGTKMPRGDKGAIMEYSVPDFDIEAQKRIGAFLAAIDAKIAVNEKINDNLQKLFAAQYAHAFVDNRDPLWERVPLSDVFFFQEGPGIRNWQYVTQDGTKFINIRCIANGDINTTTANMISNDEAHGKYAHFMLEPYDIVMSCSGTLGRYAIVRPHHLPLCLNTSVIRFRPRRGFDDFSFLYGYLTSNEFLNKQRELACGSVQANFGPTHLKKMEIVVAPTEVRNAFHEASFPLISKMIQLRDENNKLAELRDMLLPKLMSGEIDITQI